MAPAVAGYRVSGDNECEKSKRTSLLYEMSRKIEMPNASKRRASLLNRKHLDRLSATARDAVAKGCHAEFVYTQGFGISNMTREVCNQISGCQTLSERQIGSTSAIALARSR